MLPKCHNVTHRMTPSEERSMRIKRGKAAKMPKDGREITKKLRIPHSTIRDCFKPKKVSGFLSLPQGCACPH